MTVLIDQIVPSDSAWLIEEEEFAPRSIAHDESILTLANGYAGVRGSLEMSPALGDPGCYVAGVFDRTGGFEHEIVNLPCWLGLTANLDGFDFDLRKGAVLAYRRALDMRQGLLFTSIRWRNEAKHILEWESIRLLHATEKHLGIVWGKLTAVNYGGTLRLGSTLDAWLVKHGSPSGETRYEDMHTGDMDGEGISLDVTTRNTRITVAEASRLLVVGAQARSVAVDDDRVTETFRLPLEIGKPVYFEKRAVIHTSLDTADPASIARAELQRLAQVDATTLLCAHIRAWAQRWDAADIEITGDARAQYAIRFNLYHQLSLANPADDRVSIGAKGLHGNGYLGRVFWDTEIYLLPQFVFTDPPTARALLQYRHRHLADAMQNAAARGFAGAYYPWNSTLIGREYPNFGWQEHVGSDIAYAVDLYTQATGDGDFFLRYGAELIIATALYWASRVEYDAGKGYVIRQLMGPDEIHGNINNNTFTNYLVRWHLRRAFRAVAELREAGAWEPLRDKYALTAADVARWTEISDGMYINFSAEQGFHEQFDGYFALPERAIDRNMTKMEYTGPVQHSFKPTQVTQQADTVLMYHLFPLDFPTAVKRAGYAYYEPRCTHTSTLSRSIYAAVAAQADLLDDAYRLFLISAETDFGATAECDSGIHAACLGGNWQAVVMGFGGLSLRDGLPCFTPHLPPAWERLIFRLRWRESTLRVDLASHSLRLVVDGRAVTVCVGNNTYEIGEHETVIALDEPR